MYTCHWLYKVTWSPCSYVGQKLLKTVTGLTWTTKRTPLKFWYNLNVICYILFFHVDLIVLTRLILQKKIYMHSLWIKKKICTLDRTGEKWLANLTFLYVSQPHKSTFYIKRQCKYNSIFIISFLYSGFCKHF